MMRKTNTLASKPRYILAIDQGTTSSRAMVFDASMKVVASAQKEFPQVYPQSGWVEHDPEAIWSSVLATMRLALRRAKIKATALAGIGITNQRETIVLWDRKTGKPLHNAIVWQDRRTSAACQRLKEAGHEKAVQATTGLLLDPYFSATKIAWLLDHVKSARDRAAKGQLAVGTIDTFLISRLTKGNVHATDATNASRTMLLNIASGQWEKSMLDLFDIPQSLLPEVRDCAADFGVADAEWLGATVPILGVAGDQQAALIGQACFEPGMMKATYGTGCFALLNVGPKPVRSRKRLLTTIGYQLNGVRHYALEGSIFIAGAAVQWLRDGIRIIDNAAETGKLATKADPTQHVVLVPAFVGMGAPYWDAECRGALYGLTRGTGRADIAKAALESVCFQTRDLIEAMQADWTKAGASNTILRVDGGMTASTWTMQRLADMLGAPVDRPKVLETTALGAAYLAGLQAGLYPEPHHLQARWKRDRRFDPGMDQASRDGLYGVWQDAVRRTLGGLGAVKPSLDQPSSRRKESR